MKEIENKMEDMKNLIEFESSMKDMFVKESVLKTKLQENEAKMVSLLKQVTEAMN